MSENKYLCADLRGYVCPACKVGLWGKGRQATPAERAAMGETTPTPGAMTVCLNCQAFLVFDGKGGIRLLTLLEFNALDEGERQAANALATILRGFQS